VTTLPGWTVQQGTFDLVDLEASLVPADKLIDPTPPPLKPKAGLYAPGRALPPADPNVDRPKPELGKTCLKLEVKARTVNNLRGQPLPPPQALERTYLAVHGPAVRFEPGTWVRVSGWVKVPAPLAATADGALMFDDAAGEPLAVRVTHTGGWKRFCLYRKVPASGQIAVTLALTGIGAAYFDDVRIEPMAAGTTAEKPALRVPYGTVMPNAATNR
jgi:hypothetical protein